MNSILTKQRKIAAPAKEKRKKWSEERRKVLIEKYDSLPNMSQAKAAEKQRVKLGTLKLFLF